MKKSTLETITSFIMKLEEVPAEVVEANQELFIELHRNDAKKAEKTSAYDTAWEAVRELLSKSNKPLSAAEIAEQAELPEGFSKGKVVYGLGHDWADRVVKVEGKVNEYKLKS